MSTYSHDFKYFTASLQFLNLKCFKQAFKSYIYFILEYAALILKRTCDIFSLSLKNSTYIRYIQYNVIECQGYKGLMHIMS